MRCITSLYLISVPSDQILCGAALSQKKEQGKMETRVYWHRMLEILFPRKCPVCDQIIMPKGAVICPECRRRVNLVTEPRCLKCGKQLFCEEAEYCDGCEKKTFHYTRGLVLLNYDSVARKILTALKYHGKCDNADYLAAETVARLREEILGMQADCFVPVPVHPRRKRVRGFNQAELIAKRLGERMDIPVRTDVLKRIKNTLPQKELGSSARLNNLLKAFAVKNTEKLEGKTVILVDDVHTTGATLHTCAALLKAAGATEIFFVTVGRTEGNTAGNGGM